MADTINISDDSLDRLAQRLKGMSGNSTGGGKEEKAGLGGFGEALGKASKDFNPLADALKLGGAAADGMSKAYNAVRQEVQDGLGTWRKLSDSGASFSNDIIGMQAAAVGSRLTLDEFADVMKKNSGNFNGLGGNAAKGAEQFARLSKEMADSGVNDDLRRLGMSSKDINEVLALQVGLQQNINMDNEQQRKKAIESAVKLATEMDSMAKLTGVSRKEQEENMKKAQADMQVEAKMRIIGAKEGPEAEAKARAIYAEQYNAAQLRGQGQMFKEVFATGTIQSQEAASQVAVSGREAQMTMAQAKATAAGDAKAASEYSKQAQIEAIKNGQDVNKLNLAVYSSNTEAGKAMKDSMTANLGMAKAEQAVRAKMEKDGSLAGMSEQQKAAKVHEETLAQIKLEQTNKNADGTNKAGSESTDALLKMGRAAGDVKSAFMDEVVKPINEKVGPALNSIAEKVIPAQVTRNKTAAEGGGQETVGSGVAYKKDTRIGFDEGQKKTTTSKDEAIKSKEPDTGYGLVGQAARGAGNIAGLGGDQILKVVNIINSKLGDEIPKKADGGTVTKPELAIIGEAGKEHIIPDSKLQTLMQNVKLDGLSKATEALAKGSGSAKLEMPKLEMPKLEMPKLDLSSISKSINTTVSSVSGGGSTETKRVQNDSSKDAEKELAAVREQMQAERNALREKLKVQIGDGSKMGGNAVAKEMRTGDEGKAIADKYKAMMEPLQKQIDAGISIEVTKKASAIEETTKIANEQLSIIKVSNGTLSNMYKDGSKDKLATAKQDTESLDSMYKDDSKAKLDLAKKTNADAFKEAELAKSVIGTSVKGMSDDMIESMIPKGSKIENYYIDMNDKLQNYSADTVAKIEKTTKDSANVVESYSTTASSSSKKITADMSKTVSTATNPGTGTGAVAAPVVDMASMSKMVNTTVSSATSPGAGGAAAPVDDAAVNEWKKWIAKSGEFKADAEKETAIKTTESIKARLADRQSQVAALEQTASQRELTDKEKSDLAIAQSGVRRATNNLKDQEDRLVAIDQLEKQGASKIVDSKKSEVAEVVKQEETKKASVVAQSVFSAMATIGLTDNQKKMYGEFANLSAEDSAKKQASLKEEEASARAANTAASKARDAIEEKAELEGRKMTEAEEAEHKALGIIQNASSDKITAAQEEQKVLSRADEQRVFQAKVQTTQTEMQTEVSNKLAEIAKNNGLASQESLQKEAEAKAREESVKAIGKTEASAKETMPKTTGKPGESAQAQTESQATAKTPDQTTPKKSIADTFGAMFADIKLPDVQKITSTATRINPPEDVAKKTEEDKKAKVATDAKAAEVKKPAEAPKATGEVTLKEVHASLEHLNKSMAQMLTYTQQTATASQQQVKATKNLSGNKFS